MKINLKQSDGPENSVIRDEEAVRTAAGKTSANQKRTHGAPPNCPGCFCTSPCGWKWVRKLQVGTSSIKGPPHKGIVSWRHVRPWPRITGELLPSGCRETVTGSWESGTRDQRKLTTSHPPAVAATVHRALAIYYNLGFQYFFLHLLFK